MSADPSPNTTPPPPGGGPSPQQIGRAFIKQYYKILLTAPSQLNRFYQPDSTVSRGMEPSAPAPPSPFNLAASGAMNGGADESSPGERVRKAFFDWAGSDSVLRIDFERGAIDAQESIGGGILLVITGHMFLPGKSKPSPFVHTFFLNNAAGAGRKKQFLVKNDILRFLEPVADEAEVEEAVEEVIEAEVVAVVPEMVAAPVVVVEEPVAIEQPAPVVTEEPILFSPLAIETVPIVPVEYEPSADEEKVEEDDEIEEPIVEHTIVDVDPAAEEEKIDIAETSSAAGSDSSPAASPTSSDGKKSKRNRKKKGGKSRSRSNSPRKEDVKEETPEKPKTPGSWASLVASSGPPKSNNSEGKSKGGRRGSPKGSRGGTATSSDNKSSSNQESVKAPPQSQPAKEPTAASTATPTTPSSSAAAPSATTAPQSSRTTTQRTPEATLFIRNIPDKTQESEIRALFESQGNATGNKILGITLNPNRGFCFVDFDGPAAVMAIVNESSTSLVKDMRTGRKIESSFMVHGRVLEVERKVQSGNKGGSSGGGRRYNRSHSPKDSGGRYRGSRGGGGSSSGGGGMRRSPPRDGGGGRTR
mmetsp:Transcript_33178/g.69811  ORF Transcript_33178/g.69811 Transcript_33178/m.69811 type:complete len:587 (-) Transcript_33178:385-2145(-)|eukprot:CAMPEP_0172297722 /NCGR_PEP_ID=MMETSP1058-20130122/637_1 /TAXON_ID=83371 /ORGANISM="Detonula confervacea, Strain CCMP 353" /LENGTH=586 /DNA_ID=CAMNT_0013006903 /DNA_START=166 /DNA_END=1926 /DNA_ORIENTATION=+